MKPFSFRAPLFPARVRVFFSLEDYYKKYPERANENTTNFEAFVADGGSGVISLVLIKYSDANLAHECVRAAWAVLNYACAYVEHDNDEPLAYMVGHIFDKVQKHYKKESANV
ncbi:hypothetical protein AH01_57 [Pantoea phage AH01]|nr:hypothetical protein AH01_57 [Pantoea phage AH01]